MDNIEDLAILTDSELYEIEVENCNSGMSQRFLQNLPGKSTIRINLNLFVW